MFGNDAIVIKKNEEYHKTDVEGFNTIYLAMYCRERTNFEKRIKYLQKRFIEIINDPRNAKEIVVFNSFEKAGEKQIGDATWYCEEGKDELFFLDEQKIKPVTYEKQISDYDSYFEEEEE